MCDAYTKLCLSYILYEFVIYIYASYSNSVGLGSVCMFEMHIYSRKHIFVLIGITRARVFSVSSCIPVYSVRLCTATLELCLHMRETVTAVYMHARPASVSPALCHVL